MNRIEATPFRDGSGRVYVDNVALDLPASLKVRNHSPDGFAWGYGGSGPAQLALAILLRFTDRETACRLYQEFKWEHVSTWPQDGPLDQEVDVPTWIRQRTPGATLRDAQVRRGR